MEDDFISKLRPEDPPYVSEVVAHLERHGLTISLHDSVAEKHSSIDGLIA